MKKLLFAVLFSAAVLFTGGVHSYAAGNVVESPHIKIDINGQIGNYTDVPLIKDGRTLLPLRAVMANLGVPNDDRHIIWNASDRSVTVIKDSTQIFLKVDTNTAYVNNSPVTIDVAPVIYKDRTYVPVRFISQSLGMKVAWDPAAALVLIKDESEFNKVKETLEKTTAAMNGVERYKSKATLKMGFNLLDIGINSTIEIDALTDNRNKTGYAAMDIRTEGEDSSLAMELYMANNSIYVKNPLDNTWEKEELTQEEYDAQFTGSGVDNNEVAYSGLTQLEGTNPDEIILKGNVAMYEALKENLAGQDLGEYKVDNAYTEITIDKNTNLIKRIYVKVNGTVAASDLGNTTFTLEMTGANSDFNGNFTVALPAELK